MSRTTRINASPVAGGRLITSSSAEKATLNDYTRKLNWRRVQDAEKQAEGHDYFFPDADLDGVNVLNGAPFPLLDFPEDPGPINLIHQAERPNGQTAIIVGTRTALYRHVGFTETAVFYDGTNCPGGDQNDCDACEQCKVFEDGVYEEQTTKAWLKIGGGFDSPNRWEADNINGYAFLNNGADLPVTYRVEESQVVPVYELRDLGYASFGTCADYVDIQVLGDCREIDATEFERISIPRLVERNSLVMCREDENVSDRIEFSTPYIENRHVGWHIHWDTGQVAKITAWVDDRHVDVTVAEGELPTAYGHFSLRIHASQIGSVYSPNACAYARITVQRDQDDNSTLCEMDVVDANGSAVGFFDGSEAGNTIRLTNGWSAVISANNLTSSHCELLDSEANPADAPEDYEGVPFWYVDPGDFWVIAEADAFTEDDVGKIIAWDDGSSRRIETYSSPKQVIVDFNGSIESGPISMENPETYGRIDDPTVLDRRHFRVAWSLLNEPRRYGANYYGAITEGSLSLVLEKFSRSFEVGDTLVIAGAGVEGGNHVAVILSVLNGKVVTLNTPAATTVSHALIQEADSINGIAGYDDPTGDYSAVLKMLELSGTLVIYKAQSVVLATFTGRTDFPFTWRHIGLPNNQVLYFRHTLVLVNGQYHLYAGRYSFLRFEMGSRRPSIFGPLELCENLFFDEGALLADTETVYAANNTPSQEIWIVRSDYPAAANETLCFDYKLGSVRTTDVAPTAAMTVHRPLEIFQSQGIPWFLMALGKFPDGHTLAVYGKCAEPVSSWGGRREIYYRRDAVVDPATVKELPKLGYGCVIESGLSWAQAPSFQRQLVNYTVHMSSLSPDHRLDISLIAANTIGEPEVIDEFVLANPVSANMVPTNFLESLYGDRIEIVAPEDRDPVEEFDDSIENGCAIVMRAFRMLEVTTEDATRVYQ
jgi:hypothetical protein